MERDKIKLETFLLFCDSHFYFFCNLWTQEPLLT